MTQNDAGIVNDIRFARKRKKKKAPRTLPPHVFEKDGRWYVRRHFPTAQRTASGRTVYLQVVRRCDPHTFDRARGVYEEIAALRDSEVAEVEREHTVESFLATYLAVKKNAVAERTAEGDDQLFRLYVKDSAFGRMPLPLVSTLSLQEFYGHLGEHGASGAMVRKVHRLLSAAFALAVVWGRMPHKPKGIVLPRAKDLEIEFFSKSEARKLSEACLANPDFFVIALALETAMRPGEYLGLRWSDIDLDASTVSVRQAISFLRSSGYKIKPPKTKGSRRTIHISPQLRDGLARHREAWLARIQGLERRAKAPIDNKHFNGRRGVNYKKRKSIRDNARDGLEQTLRLDLVFSTSTGGPIAAHNLAIRTMADACEKAGLPRRSLYSLRHTCITLMLADGVDVKTIAERAGTSANMIWKTYSHVLAESRSGASEKIAKALY